MKNRLKILAFIIASHLLSLNIYCQTDDKEVESQTGFVNSNGLTLAYESFGENGNESIIMIQGTGSQLTAWPELLCKNLAREGYRVIRFDNRDVGLTSKLDSLGMPDWASIIPALGSCDASSLPYTLEDMGKDVIGLMDALNIKKAHVVGASMGGAIAQLVAIHYPDRVLTLTSIMASSGNPKRVSGNPKVLGLMASPPPQTDDKEVLTHYFLTLYKAIGSPGYPTEDGELKKIIEEDLTRSWYPMGTARQAAAVIIGDNCDRRNYLKELTVPTLVIHGEDDPVVNIEAGKEVAAAIPSARFISFPGMGHDLPKGLISGIGTAILSLIKHSVSSSPITELSQEK